MRYPARTTHAILLSLTLAVVLVAGCDVVGDLEEDPKSFAAPSNFYTNPAQIEGVFAGAMSNLWGFWTVGYDWSMLNAFNETDQFRSADLVIPANHAAHLWRKHYENIKNLNFAIASLQEGKVQNVSQDVVDDLMGQAKLLRGWNYFMLVRGWGGLPLLTEDDVDNYFNAQPTRSTVAETYDLIVSDLTEAVEKLPESYGGMQSARPTADVARALLAEAYVTMATYPLNQPQYYQDALNYAKQVIDGGRYDLVQDVDKVFSFETQDGPEMMWSFQSNYEKTTISPQVWSSIRGWGDQSASIWWAEKYPEQPRKHAYLELENEEGVSYQELGRRPGINKYLYDSAEDYSAGRSIIELPIIRYAEVLLLYAEAANAVNGGPTQDAVDKVNMIIDRANGYEQNPANPRLTTAMSQAEFDAAVIEERNWELCFEYDRWFDLIRKRILKEKSRPEIQQNFSEADYLWPIPNKDIRLNENLQQNPGY